VTRWVGRELVDVSGSPIGTVVTVCGPDVSGTRWLVVETGPPGSDRVLVPADRIRPSGERLAVSYHQNYIKGAPQVGDESSLSESERRRLYLHYGLFYAAPGDESARGCGLCQRRVRGECTKESSE
jgi:hypothetical protein